MHLSFGCLYSLPHCQICLQNKSMSIHVNPLIIRYWRTNQLAKTISVCFRTIINEEKLNVIF